MAAVIYNCKRCKQGRRVHYERVRGHSGYVLQRLDQAGKVIAAGVWVQRSGGGAPTVYGGDPLGVCSGCARAMTYGTLRATARPEVKCNAICTHARGFTCDCSCGGENHGSGWQVGAAHLFKLA